LLEPVFAGVLAWILLAERISSLQILGGAILLVGVAITLRKKGDAPLESSPGGGG
jgi:drug/metabolite transporter (DMT)-like permease